MEWQCAQTAKTVAAEVKDTGAPQLGHSYASIVGGALCWGGVFEAQARDQWNFEEKLEKARG
jgi:hypothetical protein